MAWIRAQLGKSPNGVLDYAREMNTASIDGLAAIEADVLPDRVASGRR